MIIDNGIYKKYYLTDIESGWTYEVTKEQHSNYLSVWKAAMPKIDSHKLKGKILIYGTGGEIQKNDNELEKMFFTGGSYITKEDHEIQREFFYPAYNHILDRKPKGKLRRISPLASPEKMYVDEIGDVFEIIFKSKSKIFMYSTYKDGTTRRNK